MAWHDRDYNREDHSSPVGSAGGVARFGNVGIMYPAWGSISLWLILINFGLLLVDGIVTRAVGPTHRELSVLAHFFAFSVETTFMQFRIWELITYQFQHADLGHALGNMLFIFFFGPMVESYFGSRRFLAFVLLCGIGGVLGYLVLWGANLFDTTAATPLVGASAQVFGVMIAALFVAPNMRVLLFFLIPVPLKAVVFMAMFMAVYVVLAGGPNAGGEAAHLGGALIGLILIKRARWLDFADRLHVPNVRGRVRQQRDQRAQKRRAASDAEVDRILAKVKDKGLHSLTRSEKRTLHEATNRQRRAG